MLVCIEGPDGVGKSTQAEWLYNSLISLGMPAKYIQWNSGLLIPEVFRRINTTEFCDPVVSSTLVAGEFAFIYENHIQPYIQDRTVVICDRYVPTAFARDVARGTPRLLIDSLYPYAATPHLGFVLKVESEEIVSRLERKSESGFVSFWESGLDVTVKTRVIDALQAYVRGEFSKEEIRLSTFQFVSAVYDNYLSLADAWNLRFIDANCPIEEVHETIKGEVLRLWEEFNYDFGDRSNQMYAK